MISRDEIAGIFSAQLARIEDEKLRDKVVDTWQMGCERGGWKSLAELEKVPFTLLTGARGINLIEHTIAVAESAVAIAKAQMEAYKDMPYTIDMDRLMAGGILHDVGKLLEIEPDGSGGFRRSFNGRCARHPISGAILAAEAGLSEEMVNTIACHAKEGEGQPQVIETILIHQADFASFNPLVMLDEGKLIQSGDVGSPERE